MTSMKHTKIQVFEASDAWALKSNCGETIDHLILHSFIHADEPAVLLYEP